MWGERRSAGVWRSERDFICLEENGAWLRVLHPVRQRASFPCPELTKHAYFTSPYQAILARDISILSSYSMHSLVKLINSWLSYFMCFETALTARNMCRQRATGLYSKNSDASGADDARVVLLGI